MTLQKNDIIIDVYTDGACFGNPGPGGWAFIYYFDNLRYEISGGCKNTTNNRMELFAVIKALENTYRFEKIRIFSDSKYVVDGATKWIIKWRKNNWHNSKKLQIKNFDLWSRIDALLINKNISWKWVKAHAGNPLNEEVDILAKNEAAKFTN